MYANNVIAIDAKRSCFDVIKALPELVCIWEISSATGKLVCRWVEHHRGSENPLPLMSAA